MPELSDLPKTEFAFPGTLRDQLVAAVLSGEKTSTSGLMIGYERDGDPLPPVGDRSVMVDSDDRPVAILELTEVRVVRIGDIGLAHARDEGEGYETVAQWRAGHERFWHSPEFRNHVGDPTFTIDDDTLAVTERFRVVERL